MPIDTSRPYITCHVLDTTSGKPAPDIAVKLSFVKSPHGQAENSPQQQWHARTNNDGRVVAWEPSDPTAWDLNAFVLKLATRSDEAKREAVFALTFDTEAYFGKGKTFWPEVELRFAVKLDEPHYHVPLLLGPWSYTTYRGS